MNNEYENFAKEETEQEGWMTLLKYFGFFFGGAALLYLTIILMGLGLAVADKLGM